MSFIVPLNTSKQFVMATTKCGCEVYMPVVTENDEEQKALKEGLQKLLDVHYSSFPYEPPPLSVG